MKKNGFFLSILCSYLHGDSQPLQTSKPNSNIEASNNKQLTTKQITDTPKPAQVSKNTTQNQPVNTAVQPIQIKKQNTVTNKASNIKTTFHATTQQLNTKLNLDTPKPAQTSKNTAPTQPVKNATAQSTSKKTMPTTKVNNSKTPIDIKNNKTNLQTKPMAINKNDQKNENRSLIYEFLTAVNLLRKKIISFLVS